MRTTALSLIVAACATAAIAVPADWKPTPATRSAPGSWRGGRAGPRHDLVTLTAGRRRARSRDRVGTRSTGPAADERVQFENGSARSRHRSGAEGTAHRDDFDILALLPRRMLLGPAGRVRVALFFRVTVSREVVRVPDPPATGANDADTALCEHLTAGVTSPASAAPRRSSSAAAR
jgi:hypothetical protein